MKTLVKQACRGRTDAALKLTDNAGKRVLALCRACIEGPKEAEATAIQALTTALDHLVTGNCADDKAFEEKALSQAALLCRKTILPKGKKYLAVPRNKNFIITPIDLKADKDNSAIRRLLNAMPNVQRYIFALHRVAGLDESGLCAVTGYSRSVIDAALSAEAVNVERLTDKLSEDMGLTVNVQNEIQRLIDTSDYTEAGQEKLKEIIRKRIGPIRKRKGRRIAVIAAVAAACLALILVLVLSSRNSEDGSADYDFTETESTEEQTDTDEDTEEETEDTTEEETEESADDDAETESEESSSGQTEDDSE